MRLFTKIIETRKSKYNGELSVVKNFGLGTYIQAGGLTQSGGIVETIWKQTIKKVYSKKKSVRNILILGYGGGTISKIVCKFWPDAKITGIDIDSVIVELGKKHLDSAKFNTNIIIGDAFEKINKTHGKYDLIFVDLYQGDNFPEKFKSDKFLSNIKKHLNDKGVIIFNRLYYGDKRPETVKFGNNLKKYFSEVVWFYPEANLMFLCSK